MKKLIICFMIVSAFVTFSPASQGAETVHLFLKLSGTDIKGESTQTSLGRADSIECLFYQQRIITAREAGSGLATGRRQYEPILIRKRIDKSSPLLLKGLRSNQQVDAVFRFYRPNPNGDGTTEQFYSVEIRQGRIASIRQYLPDTTIPATSQQPPLEEVTFVFGSITWTYTQGGITDTDSVSAF